MNGLQVGRWCGLAALAMSTACGGAPEGGGDDVAPVANEPAVGHISQDLGNWTELYAAPSSAILMHVGPWYTFLLDAQSDPQLGCVPHVVRTQSGTQLDVPALGSCNVVTGVTSDSTGLFVIVDRYPVGHLYSLVGAKNGTYSWRELAETDTNYTEEMLVSSTHVYWEQNDDIYRVPRSGGAATRVATNRTLVAVDGDALYVNQKADSGYHLSRMPLAGGAETRLRSNGYYMGGRTTFDATHFYSVWNNTPPHSIRRLNKDGTSPVTVKESPTISYGHAFSTGAMLYWTESSTYPDPPKLRRKNLSDGNHVTVSMPVAREELMIVTSAGVYVAGTSSETGDATLFRSSL